MKRKRPPQETGPRLDRARVVELLEAIVAAGGRVDGWDAMTRSWRHGTDLANPRLPAWDELCDGLRGVCPSLYGLLLGDRLAAGDVDELADRLLVEAAV